uniref:Glucan endo-1,3-beta-D-glucosidase n=1 Tax=Picea sitchensis TaxID=3332 RepID=A9NZD0_PICSI|nr:unknown [Picea sitchensis]
MAAMKIMLIGCIVIFCSSILADADRIGVNNGMVGNNLPHADEVVTLLKNNNIGKYRIFQGSPGVLKAFENSGIDVIVGIETNILQKISSSQAEANSWINENIRPFYPATNIKYIAVGNEVFKSKENIPYLVPAMKNIQAALKIANLQNNIKVSTTHASESVIGNSFPPSKGVFTDDVKSTMTSVLQFLSDNGAPFMANVYPFFSYVNNWKNIKLEYALFKSTSPVVDGNHSYANLFDAIVDTIISAMEDLGYPNVPLIVTESGWPSAGKINVATIQNAQTYNNNLIRHVLSNAGTPKRPGRSIETYIFALFNEDKPNPDETESHYGLFYPSKTPVYTVNFSP